MPRMLRHAPQRWLSFGALALVSAVLLSACALDFSGGGVLPSATGNGIATFGFVFHCSQLTNGGDSCVGGIAQGNYSDSGAGVQLHITGNLESGGPGLGYNNCYSGTENYIVPGVSGGPWQVRVTACDNGNPGRGNDFLVIDVLTGPYAGYHNSGVLLRGNLSAR